MTQTQVAICLAAVKKQLSAMFFREKNTHLLCFSTLFKIYFRNIKTGSIFLRISTIFGQLKDLKNHLGVRRYAANTFWVFIENILRMIAGLLVGIWVARYLGPDKFGTFSYALAFTSIFGGLAKLGLDSIIVRDLLKHPERRDICLGTAFRLKLAGAFLMLAVIAVCQLPAGNDFTTNLYIMIIASGIIFQSFEVIDFYFQSQVLSKFVSICKIIQLCLSSAVKVYLVLSGAELFWFVLIAGADQAMLAISLSIAYKLKKQDGFLRCFDWALARQMLSDGWPLILSIIGTALLYRIDQLIIKQMMGVDAVGLYAAAVKLAEIWFFIPTIITGSLFPAIVNAKNRSQELCDNRFMRLYSLLIWLAIAISVFMTFTGHWVITMLYGAKYASSANTLIILSWTSVFIFLGNASKKWFIVENLQRLLLYRIFGGVILNVILNLVLIPRYGIEGAAMATLISYGYTFYFSYIFNPRLRGLFFLTTKSFSPKYIFKGLSCE